MNTLLVCPATAMSFREMGTMQGRWRGQGGLHPQGTQTVPLSFCPQIQATVYRVAKRDMLRVIERTSWPQKPLSCELCLGHVFSWSFPLHLGPGTPTSPSPPSCRLSVTRTSPAGPHPVLAADPRQSPHQALMAEGPVDPQDCCCTFPA